ncbi:MAG: hypothetical protein ACM3PF_06910 [Bacteroidota bacterium]
MRLCLVVTLAVAVVLSGSALPANATSFLTQTVDPSAAQSIYGSLLGLAVDSQGRAHVAYIGSGGLRYASETPGGWTLQTVPTGAAAIHGVALDIDALDRPVIAYWSPGAPGCYHKLGLVTDTGSGWTPTSVLDCSLGEGLAMDLDPQGLPHMAYSSGFDGLHYVAPAGSSWSDEFVYSQPDYYPEMALAVDDAGRPHLAAQILGIRWVRYSVKEAGVWSHQTVEVLNSQRYYVSLALDGSGTPSLAYMDTGTNTLRFASRTASGWNPLSVPGTTSGTHTSLAIDSQGDPRIAYSDGQLRYVSRKAGAWTVERVAAGGTYASLKLDANDMPRMAYIGEHGLQYSRGVRAELRFAPAKLNIHRDAPWVTVFVEAVDFDPAALDVSSLRIGSAAPEPKFAILGDVDADGVPDLMLKFAASGLTPMLHDGANAVVLTGRLLTGEEVAIAGTMRVVDPGPHAAEGLSLRIVSRSGMDPVSYVVGGTARAARVQVFDVQGRLVRSWANVPLETVRTWDGTREDGVRVGSGLYFIRADRPGVSAVRRVVVRR